MISFLKKSSWCPCPLKKSYWEFYDSFKSTCVLVIPTVSTGIHFWKIFTIHLMNLCVVILTISTYIFHLRNILIYVQDLLVFHCKTIFIHAYIDESLTRLPTLPTPSPRGLLSTVTWHWSAGRVWDWRGIERRLLCPYSPGRNGELQSLEQWWQHISRSTMWHARAWGSKLKQ